ncbi:MAG: hypothetical protein ABI600_09345 [Luteolibacter sp.]
MFIPRYAFTVCFLLSKLGIADGAPIPGPAGLFVIGDTHAVAGEVAKFDLDFVSGYTLRIPWKDIESWNPDTGAPAYDFSRIDSTLEDLRLRGKRMTLEIFVTQAPDYILADPGTGTWFNPNPQQGGTQVLPWDANSLAAYHAMIQSLANHQVAGTTWKVAEHPALESVDAPIVGLQGLRELSNTLINLPGYQREAFIQSVVDAVTFSRGAFPRKFGFLALFAMNDNNGGVRMDEAVYARLMSAFNQPNTPSLGFFQETLSDTGPRADTLGALLKTASASTYVMFQALRPWVLRSGETRPPEIASGTPVTGLNHAWTDYGSTYVEIYGADILATTNAEPLRKWQHFFHTVEAFRSGGEGLNISQTSAGSSLTWSADPILNYRLWSSQNLTSWQLETPAEPLDGGILLPNVQNSAGKYYRIEVRSPSL